MNYLFNLYARSDAGRPIKDKHEALILKLGALTGSWGLKDTAHPAPDPGQELSAMFDFGRKLRGRGVKGFASYRYRAGLRDESSCDDYITLEFNPEKVDYGSLVNDALTCYIEAFSPYFAYVADEEFSFVDFGKTNETDLRKRIPRIFPVCFLDDKLCRKALRLGASEVAIRLAEEVSSATVINGGVLIVGAVTPLQFTEAKALSDKLTKLLGAG